jgi:hypothetical protein
MFRGLFIRFGVGAGELGIECGLCGLVLGAWILDDFLIKKSLQLLEDVGLFRKDLKSDCFSPSLSLLQERMVPNFLSFSIE